MSYRRILSATAGRVVLGLVSAGLMVGQNAAPAPSSAETVAAKARALDGRGRPDLAVQSWRQVLLVDPNHQEALAALARAAKQEGRTQESESYLARLRKLNPGHPALQQVQSMRILTQQQARLREAERLAGLQQFDRALQVYREVFGDDPPEGSQAIAYYETQAAVPGGWEPATNALKTLSDKYPQSEDYRLILGKLYTYRPNTRLNGLRLLESIKTNTDLVAKARVAWRQALVWEESNPQFGASLRAYISRYPDPELQKALNGLSRPAQVTPPPTGLARTPVENIGYTALAANNLVEAESQFTKEIAETPNSAGALAGMGFVRMKQENFAQAIEFFEQATKLAPQEALVTDSLQSSKYFQRMKDAATAFNSDHLDAAAEHYRKALEVRPTALDAMQGLAGTLAKAGNWGDAMPVYESLTKMQPQNDAAWLGLLSARYRVAGADSFLASIKQLPEATRTSLTKTNLEYLSMLAVTNSDAGNPTEARANLQQAVELANARALPLSQAQEMQFAGLFLRLGYPVESASVFEKVTTSQPDNIDAWEGLTAAYIQLHQEAQANRALASMPQSVYQAVMTRPGFLRSLAAIQMSLGKLDTAREFLQRSVEIDTASHTSESVAAQLQLAHIMLRQGSAQQAETVLRKMATTYPENPDVWKALIAALHQEGREEAAWTEARRVPVAPSAILEDDVDYITLLASVEDLLHNEEQSLRLARHASDLLARNRRPIPAELNTQIAWLILKTDGDERELLALLQTLGAKSDLTPEQKKDVDSIWSTWSLKRAHAALLAGDYARAVSILETAEKILPKDAAIRATLAGAHLDAGEQVKALAVYRAWGMSDAGALDYAGAIGAAVAAGEKATANDWITKALASWPKDPTILKLAGQLAASSGDYRRAEQYWRAALVAVPDDPSPVRSAQNAAVKSAAGPGVDPRKTIGDLLLGNDKPRPAAPASPTVLPSIPRDPAKLAPVVPPPSNNGRIAVPPPLATPAGVPIARVAPARIPGGPAQGTTANFRQANFIGRSSFSVPRFLPQVQSVPGPRPAPLPKPQADPPLTSAPTNDAEAERLRGELQDRINAIEARNTPFFGFGGTVRARSGEAGFDKLIVQEANLEASAVIRNTMRFLIIARPTYLDNGTADGLSTRRFGLAPVGATFDTAAIGGLGGEAQLATQTFGLRAGVTPQNFLVPNFFGGVRFRPGNGPVTIIAERDSIKDSLLSFAGVRDPITNRIWGGVVSNGVSVQGKFGGEKSGVYASFGYQLITGRQVARNTRLDGNLGSYWQVFKNNDGGLTAGFNLFAMHYEKNLRFYTLGQGGYFSPQRYLLLNFPLEWRGIYRRKVQYVINGGVGSQHFQEDASDYFPTQPALQGRAGPAYPKRVSTGANYSMDARTAYQVTPRLHLGAYANLNNARNYTSQSFGFYLRFSTKPRSVREEFGLPSVPDWKGVEPFGLP